MTLTPKSVKGFYQLKTFNGEDVSEKEMTIRLHKRDTNIKFRFHGTNNMHGLWLLNGNTVTCDLKTSQLPVTDALIQKVEETLGNGLLKGMTISKPSGTELLLEGDGNSFLFEIKDKEERRKLNEKFYERITGIPQAREPTVPFSSLKKQ